MITNPLHQHWVEFVGLTNDPLLLVLHRKPLQEMAECGKAGARDGVVLGGDREPQSFEYRGYGALGDVLLLDIGFDACEVVDTRVNGDIGVFEGRQEVRSLCLHL